MPNFIDEPTIGLDVMAKKQVRDFLKSINGDNVTIILTSHDLKDIEEIFQYINEAGLNSTQDTIHFLPFWENGVKFFTIEGPNKEKVEFSQYL